MKRFKIIVKVNLLAVLACISACSSGINPSYDVLLIPDVNLKGQELQRYQNDVQTCQKEIIQIYKNKLDSRNKMIDFRECLIRKGYLLLS